MGMRKSSYTIEMSETKGPLNWKSNNIGERDKRTAGDLLIKGESVLQKEIYFAQAIPSTDRVLIRQDSSLQELLQSKDDPLS